MEKFLLLLTRRIEQQFLTIKALIHLDRYALTERQIFLGQSTHLIPPDGSNQVFSIFRQMSFIASIFKFSEAH